VAAFALPEGKEYSGSMGFIGTVLISALVAAAVSAAVAWLKENVQKQKELERYYFEKLYGNLSFHLLALKVLNIKKSDLSDAESAFTKKWLTHIDKMAHLLEEKSSYIKKEHLGLVEDFLLGRSRYSASENIDKLWRSLGEMQSEVLKQKSQQVVSFVDFDLRQFALSVVLATLLILVSLALAMIFG
jgi:hypothetical protein